MISEYEKQKQRNIQRNKELLLQLELDKGFFEAENPVKPLRKKSVPKKRKTEDEEGGEPQTAPKAHRSSAESDIAATGVRRSSRNTGKRVDYNAEVLRSVPEPLVKTARSGNEGPQGSDGGKRVHNPKVFGHIPGIEVGTWWESRQGCSADAVHAPWVAGISGGSEGTYSVALSGGYEDDVDLGYAFSYTGSGGRDLKGTKNAPKNLRTAPQSSDQSFEHAFNKALEKSVETRNPIRVIRGFKLKSKYAPSEGYRYDGLYTVEKAWMEKGLNPKGYLVCKFAFKRLPGQPAIPERDDTESSMEEESTGNTDHDEC